MKLFKKLIKDNKGSIIASQMKTKTSQIRVAETEAHLQLILSGIDYEASKGYYSVVYGLSPIVDYIWIKKELEYKGFKVILKGDRIDINWK